MKINEVTEVELDHLLSFVNHIYDNIGITIIFNDHFKQQINNIRNVTDITVNELARLFKTVYERHGQSISQLSDQYQAVMKDKTAGISVPFVIIERDQHKYLIPKSIIRKEHFKTSNQLFRVK